MSRKLCRICLKSNATISIFEREDDNVQYSAKIMRCAKVNILENDGLPALMCCECQRELTLAFDFVQKCEASDNALRCLHFTDTDNLDSEIDEKICIQLKQEPLEVEIEDAGIDSDFLFSTPLKEELLDHDDSKLKCVAKVKRRKKSKGRSGPTPCVICGKMFNSNSAMDIHMRIHTGEKPFQCTRCDNSFRTKGALKRHTETFHSQRERKFTCETCGSSFFRKNDIITHLRVHTNERPYVCSYCQKSFRQIATLIRHKRVHTGDKPFACQICGKKFADKSLVKKHLSVHSDEKKYKCHLCNKCMKTKTALNTHINIMHNNQKQIICSFCGMAFSLKGNLQTHMRRVHSEKSGQCNICFKTFSDIIAHMRKHTGEKPFVCEVCNQAFSNKRSLAYHMVFKHENATKFKCSIGDCTKTFPTAMMLEFHLLKQHTHHTPYVCEHCSRGFFRNSDLTRHLKVSHMEAIQLKTPIKDI